VSEQTKRNDTNGKGQPSSVRPAHLSLIVAGSLISGDFGGDRAQRRVQPISWRSVAGGSLDPLRSSGVPVGTTRGELWLASETAIGMCGVQVGEWSGGTHANSVTQLFGIVPDGPKPVRGRSGRAGAAGSLLCRRSSKPGLLLPVRLRSTTTRPDVVQRFTTYVFVHSPQSQKNLLGKDLIANAPSSGRG
jgi:hypothetical protein